MNKKAAASLRQKETNPIIKIFWLKEAYLLRNHSMISWILVVNLSIDITILYKNPYNKVLEAGISCFL